jgi:hypothetical protein
MSTVPFTTAALMALMALNSAHAAAQGVDSLDPNSPDYDYDRCMGKYGIAECQARAGPRGAARYDAPSATAHIIARQQYGGMIPLFEPASKLTHAEWIPTYAVVAGPRGPYTRVVKAWVRRADAVLDTDFRRVVGCWPLRHVVIPEEGLDEHPGWVNFTVKGVASAPGGSGQPPAKYGVQHTYFAQGIFTVRHPSDELHDYFPGATLDYDARIVKYLGEKILKEGKQVRWFGEKDLEGCKEIPSVDDTPVPKQRRPEK